MKADTYARLLSLEALIDAEVGYWLERHPRRTDQYRETLVARVSDLVDEIDALDAVAAARTYDAVVDFLAELPEDDDEEMIAVAIRFRRAVDRIVERGMHAREMKDPSTWAVVLDRLLDELADEYHAAVRSSGEIRPREYLRARLLLARAREAADRMLWEADEEENAELRTELDRLTFAVRHQRLKPQAVDFLIRAPQRTAARYRPSTLTRIGAFVLGQVLRRDPARAKKRDAPHPAKG